MDADVTPCNPRLDITKLSMATALLVESVMVNVDDAEITEETTVIFPDEGVTVGATEKTKFAGAVRIKVALAWLLLKPVLTVSATVMLVSVTVEPPTQRLAAVAAVTEV